MNFRQLSSLVAVADTGNITRAARHMNVSQPALTKSIHDLEATAGVRLFDRHPRGVTPTPGGDALIAHARTVLAELRRARENLDRLSGSAAGSLLIGAAPVVAADLLPKALARFLEARADLTVSVQEGLNQRLLSALALGDLDMVIGPLAPDGPEAEFAERTLYQNQLAIVARSGHPMSSHPPVSLARLAGMDWILPPRDTAPRAQIDNAFRQVSVDPPAPAVETSSMSCVRALLLDTDRLTVLPLQIVSREQALGLIVPLAVDWTPPSRPMGITTRTRSTVSPVAAAFMTCLEETVRDGAWTAEYP